MNLTPAFSHYSRNQLYFFVKLTFNIPLNSVKKSKREEHKDHSGSQFRVP